MFLLNGEIFPKIAQYKKQMRSMPKNIVKSWSKDTPHVLGIVNKLINRQVNSKQKLIDAWKKDSNCKFMRLTIREFISHSILIDLDLLSEFCDFLVDASPATIALSWPPIG